MPTTTTKPAAKRAPARKPVAKKPVTPVVPPTPVEQVQAYAEKAVLIPVGAALIARERVVATAEELQAKYGTVEAAQKQLQLLRKDVSADLKKAEKRGKTARTKAEREIKKARTKAERLVRTNRTRIERDLKRNRTKAERELKAIRNDIDKQVAPVTARVEEVVAQVNKATTEVTNNVVDRVASLA